MSSPAPAIPLNPFVAAGEIANADGRGFYGREALFERLHDVLASVHRPPILLYGQRRIGKSSVLRQLEHRLPDDWCCVYFDLQGKASLDLDALVYGLMREIARVLKLPRPERALCTAENFRASLLPEVLGHLDDRPERLVLMFDEFDVIDSAVNEHELTSSELVPYLAALMRDHPGIGCLLVVGRKSEELSAAVRNSIFKNAVEERIGRLARRDVERMITELAAGVLDFDADAIARLFELSGGQPYCAQLLAHVIWSRRLRPRSESAIELPVVISRAHVDGAVASALEQGTLGLNWIFDGTVQPGYRLFLAGLAAAYDPLTGVGASQRTVEGLLSRNSVDVYTRELAHAPERLTEWDALVHEGDLFRFAVPLVGAWIRLERPLELLEKEIKLTNPKAHAALEAAEAAHQAGELRLAITQYRNALLANPNFRPAHLGLAEALRQSAITAPETGEGAILESLAAYERAMELDPAGAMQGFGQLIVTALGQPNLSAARAVDYFKRLVDLKDPRWLTEGQAALRPIAERHDRAHLFEQAEKLWRLAGDEAQADAAKRNNEFGLWSSSVFGVAGFVGLAAAYFADAAPVSIATGTASVAALINVAMTNVNEQEIADRPRLFGSDRPPILMRRTLSAILGRFAFLAIIAGGYGFVAYEFFAATPIGIIIAAFVGLIVFAGGVQAISESRAKRQPPPPTERTE